MAGISFDRMGPARLERATSCSGGKRSIQLSYGPVSGQNLTAKPLNRKALHPQRRRWLHTLLSAGLARYHSRMHESCFTPGAR